MAVDEPNDDPRCGTPRVVLLGAPGSGKGTQAAMLSARLGVPAISTGDMLRAAVAAQTALGARVQQVMAAGALVEDRLMAEVVEERLHQDDAGRGFLLDGYPRTLAQAQTLDRILESQRQVLNCVLLLEVPEDVLIARAVARQRADDREAVVRARLEVYREKTEPLVDHYRRRNLLCEIDGNQPIEAVARALGRLLELEEASR